MARQTRAEVFAIVLCANEEVTLQYPALPTSIYVAKSPRVRRRGPRLVVQMNVLDRDTGDPQTLRVFWRLPPVLPTLEHAIDWIYARVRESWAHELNEALHVGGIRRRDLHNERGGAMPPPPDTIDPWWDER